MIPENSNLYLETSAVNFMADFHGPDDGKATKIYHALKGTRFYVSPVTIWEILLTADLARRETLIHYLQNIGHHEMIVSPGELIVNYIMAGCPKAEKKYNLQSRLALSKVWSDICENPAKTFMFEQNDLRDRTEAIRVAFNSASKLIENVGITEVSLDDTTATKIVFDHILRNLKGIDTTELSEKDRKIFKISLILILLIMCGEVDFERSVIFEFWKRLGINTSMDRFEYLISKHESLIYEGPFVVLSEMINLQLGQGGKSTRGVFWDALHSIYVIYCEYFLTADDHFKRMKETSEFELFKKIIYLPESSIYKAKQIGIIRQGIVR